MSDMFFRILTLLPFVEGYEEERIISTRDAAQETITRDRGYFFDSGDIQKNFFDLLSRDVRSLKRSGIRKRQIRIEISLVFVRQKADWDTLSKISDRKSVV